MRCADFDELIADDLAGELDPTRRRELDEHLSGCAACTSRLEDQLRVDGLLRSSLSTPAVATAAVLGRVRARIHAAPWWQLIFHARQVQVAVAVVVAVIATLSFVRSRTDPSAAYLFRTAAADHVEDVVQRIEKPGWMESRPAVERLAVRILGDVRLVEALSPAGYSLLRARPCEIEGKAATWLHLVYSRGASEVSLFVRSTATAPASKGQLALTPALSTARVGDLQVVGFELGAYGMVVVAELSAADALRVARAAASRIS